MPLPIVTTALSGLRLLRGQPRLFLWWGGVQLLFTLATFPFFSSLQAELMSQQSPADTLHTIAMLIPFWIGSIVLWTVLFGASVRALLAPESGRYGYMRIGMDEVRLFVTALALYLILYVVMVMVALVLAIVLLVPIGLIFGGETGNGAIAIGIAVLIIAMTVISGWAATRLVLAVPLSLEGRWCAFRTAWRLSKGHVWRLFATALLATLIMSIVLLPVLAITYLPIISAGGLVALSDPQQIVAMQAQTLWFSLPIGAVATPIYLALMGTPIAAALVLLRGEAGAVTP